MIKQFLKNFPGLEKRKWWALSYIFLSVPMAFLPDSDQIRTVGNPSSQSNVFLAYLSLVLLFLTFIFQVFYTGLVFEDSVHNEKKPKLWLVFVKHFPGNFLISCFIEPLSFILFFLDGYLTNQHGMDAVSVGLIKACLSIPIYGAILELWFRYYRFYLSGTFKVKIDRKNSLLKNSKTLLILGGIFMVSVFFPSWGAGLAVANTMLSIAGIILWELLGLEIKSVLHEYPSL